MENGPGSYRSPRAPPTGPAGAGALQRGGARRGEARRGGGWPGGGWPGGGWPGPARPGRSPLPAPARRRSGAPRSGAGAGRRRGRHVGSVRGGGGGPEGSRGQSRRRRVAGKGRGFLPPSLPGEAAGGGLPNPAGAAASRRCPVPHAVVCPSEGGRRCRGWDPRKSAGRPSCPNTVSWAVHGRLRGLAGTDGAPRGGGSYEIRQDFSTFTYRAEGHMRRCICSYLYGSASVVVTSAWCSQLTSRLKVDLETRSMAFWLKLRTKVKKVHHHPWTFCCSVY
ncbi:translation initiation factor IF-2-like [Aquila chrysaetos chrysaetos]|uniref:translation initiation factor IF-2-like n=1 Tax=Aquila chrysaetos chrysaetos TaxID=223781 RepID=UPI001B7D369E|nr:translation initiation factor IF-2-like [Aquila chrysaetos chrysaetos]